MQLFRPMWEEAVNEQFYRDYPHLRPDPEAERRKLQERLQKVPPVILQAAYEMVRGQERGQWWNRTGEKTHEPFSLTKSQGKNTTEGINASETSRTINTDGTAAEPSNASTLPSNKVQLASGEEKLYEIKLPRDKKKAIISRGISEKAAVFTEDIEDNFFASYVKNVQPKDGIYDVALHGSDTNVQFFGERIDAYTLSQIIRQRKDYKPGMPIRLLSCSTGNTDNTGDCVAQIVANELGVVVEAPDGILYAFENGSISIGDKNEGKMKLFYPRK